MMDNPHQLDGLNASQGAGSRVCWELDTNDVSSDPIVTSVKLRRSIPVEAFAEQLSVVMQLLEEEHLRKLTFQAVPYRYGESGTLEELVLVAT